jgi:hypothetical protein
VFESDTLKVAVGILSTISFMFFTIPLFIAFLLYDYFGPHSE